ncbi:MAG: hypothetical protein Q8N84_03020, partial [bacterium]|nr:hypothetical protein [bacterium]
FLSCFYHAAASPVYGLTTQEMFPYEVKIESINPSSSCLQFKENGSQIIVTNNCQTNFYFYDFEGKLNQSLLLVNTADRQANPEKYQALSQKTGKDYRGFYPLNPSLNCGEGEVRRVAGVNVCDYQELKKKIREPLALGDWSLRVFSEADQKDVVIRGKLFYKPGSPNIRTYTDLIVKLSLLIVVVTAITLLFCKYLLKKSIPLLVIIALLVFSLLGYVVIRIMGSVF